MTEGSRRRVSYAQLETLWEYLNDHKDIATGYNKSTKDRDTAKIMWSNIAQSLNAQDDGAVKDWKEWSKYWVDYKAKLKKTVAAIHASQQHTGGPSVAHNLSEVQKRFLQILGDSFETGPPGVKAVPFNHVPEIAKIEDVDETVSQGSVKSTKILENIHDSSPEPGPSRLLITPPRNHIDPLLHTPAQSPNQQESNSETPELRNTPPPLTPRPSPGGRTQTQRRNPTSRTLPQKRRHRRWASPMSQEEARRNLIAISNERSRQDQIRNEVLQQLVREIRDIKEILRTRLPVPAVPEIPNHNLS